ncbi:hypothetical protein, partial [Enterococcus faecalis]|uniref:hypothetical protein n=1 Tax=Enterococcus faecalis TaxID=1351 RepID=UPI001C26980D
GHEGRRKLLDSIAEKLDMPGLIPTEEQMQKNLAGQQQQSQAQQKIEQAKARQRSPRRRRGPRSTAPTPPRPKATPRSPSVWRRSRPSSCLPRSPS